MQAKVLPDMTALDHKVALITGGAQRIGAAIARTLHHSGMRLVIHYHNSSEAAERLQRELCANRADSVLLVQGDLRDTAKIKNLIQQSILQYERLDSIINNAATFFATPLLATSEHQWSQLINSNLRAPFFLIQNAAPWLQKTSGCVVNITDIYAEHPLADHSVYCASKAALVSLTKSLAIELGPKIRVNTVAPGAILWPKHGLDEVAKQRVVSKTILKRMGSAMDVARTVLFLISESDYITGQVINVDGGHSVLS